MRRVSDFTLGAALLIGSIVYCVLVGEPGRGLDITPLFLTIPIALSFIAGDIKRIFAVRKEQNTMSVEIKNVRGHYEAYVGGRFVCSGDTRGECMETVEEIYSDDAA